MKDNIIGKRLDSEITIRVSELIKLLTVPVALRMNAIREMEEQGYAQNDMYPNREHLTQCIQYAFDGYFVEHLTTELRVKGVGKHQIGWAHDYLCMFYQQLSMEEKESSPPAQAQADRHCPARLRDFLEKVQ